MSEKILVRLDVDVWKSAIPEIWTKPVLGEREKVLIVPNEKRVRNSTEIIRTEAVFQKNLLERVTSARPGTKRCYFLLDAGADIRRSPEYRMNLIRMLDQIYADLAEAGNNLAGIEDKLYKFDQDPEKGHLISQLR